MCRNVRTAADFLGLPPNQVVELGTRVRCSAVPPAPTVGVGDGVAIQGESYTCKKDRV